MPAQISLILLFRSVTDTINGRSEISKIHPILMKKNFPPSFKNIF